MKRLQKTEFINKLLASTVGAEVDTTNHAVYEVVATSDVPLRGKQGTIFEKAVIKPQTLFQLAAAVNKDPLPLMMDHNMDGTPFGKFFYGEVVPDFTGPTELRGFLYVDPTEDKTVSKVENGTVDEVSIAFAAEKMLCSQCGWDYAKAVDEDNLIPVIMRTCENGHQIGKDGTHLELEGVKDTLELSLVSRGAAKDSKIIGQSESKLSKQVERLAAHGLSVNDLYVTASASKGFDDMDINDLVVQLSDAKAKASGAERDRAQMEEQLAEARGQYHEAQTKITQLEADLAQAQREAAAAPSAEEREEAEQNKERVKAAADYLGKEFKAVMAAVGTPDEELPEDVETLIAKIDENKSKFTDIIPINGATVSASASEKSEETPDYSMFKSKTHKR